MDAMGYALPKKQKSNMNKNYDFQVRETQSNASA